MELHLSWYTINSLTQHAFSWGFYVHPYFCFRSLAPSLSDFTCGFDTPAVTAVTGSALVPATIGTSTIIAVMGVANR